MERLQDQFRGHRATTFRRLETASVGLVLCAVPGLIWFVTWFDLQSDTRLWTIHGAPCQIVDRIPAQMLTSRMPPQRFVYDGVTFTHAHAMADCSQHPKNPAWPSGHFDICQFNSPGAVTVEIGAKKTTFQPPAGKHATVTVSGGEAGCVVGGWFNP